MFIAEIKFSAFLDVFDSTRIQIFVLHFKYAYKYI